MMEIRRYILSTLVIAAFAIAGIGLKPAAAQSGFISTVAGPGNFGTNQDGIPATTALLRDPSGVFVDLIGNIYIADLNNSRIRKVDATTGLISTVAGTGSSGFNGDGILATDAQVLQPWDVVLDASGNIYFTDTGNHRIRRVDASTGIISTVVGTGETEFNGEDILAVNAHIDAPSDLHIDGAGNLFFSDINRSRVRRVDAATGLIRTVAGTGAYGFNGDGILATDAQLDAPNGVFVDGAGNLYIADAYNNRVRRVDATTGMISTVAGTGVDGFNGDGILASTATLNSPEDVFVDGDGNLIIADSFNERIRKVDMGTGMISTVAGTGLRGFNGDGIQATTATLAYPFGVFVDGSGNLFIADFYNDRIRKVAASTGVANEMIEEPEEFTLEQNYPNPFNPTTHICFALSKREWVTLEVYDMLGKQVDTLIDGWIDPGESMVKFDGHDLPSGVYIYRLKAGSFTQVKKLTLLK